LRKAIELEQHQVGSLFKPILYRVFLENGYDLKDFVSLEKITLNLKSGFWSPRESHKNLPSQATLGESLAKSFNRPVIRIANQIGFDHLEGKIEKFIPGLKKPLKEYPAQLLGSKGLSLREIYDIYKEFIAKDCFSKNALEGGHDNEIPSIIDYLSNPLLGTVRKSVGPFLKNMRYFGKTGTSNNGHDNWYIFFTGKDLGVIWVGLEGRRERKDLNLYGSTTSFRLFQRFYRERGKSFSELNCN
jgi:penicillin-binding protein 1B